MELFDTHAHLDEEAFRPDRDEVIARRCRPESLQSSPSAQRPKAAGAVEIADRYPAVYAAVGIQPNYVAEAAFGDWETIEELATSAKVVALGETGLDRYWDYAPIELQQDYFARHIELARRLGRPFIVHCREAEADVIARFAKLPPPDRCRA